jgi:acetyl-CoA synthetase
MATLTEYTRYADAQTHADSHAFWQLFDRDRESLMIAYGRISRHADGSGRTPVRIALASAPGATASPVDDIAMPPIPSLLDLSSSQR